MWTMTLDAQLKQKLKETNDAFLPGPDHIKQWGIKVDASGTVRYN